MQKWLKDKKNPFDGKMKPKAPRSLLSLTWIKTAFNNNATKKPVLHPACKITNLCPLLRGIFRASEGLDGVH
jgi:hypothetical protein